MQIYPAIDLRNGKCVRLLQGRADRETVYSEDPAAVAREFVAAGAAWIHTVDLDGAFTGTPQNLATVAKVAELPVRVQMGGGLRDLETIRRVLVSGVARAVVGTRACESEAFVAELVKAFGDRVAVGIDAKDGRAAVRGWVEATERPALELGRRMAALGIGTIIYTDISTDGMLTGPNLAAQEAMLQAVGPRTRVIASGGVSAREDVEALVRLAGNYPNLDGVIVGKAIYEKRVDLADLIALAG